MARDADPNLVSEEWRSNLTPCTYRAAQDQVLSLIIIRSRYAESRRKKAHLVQFGNPFARPRPPGQEYDTASGSVSVGIAAAAQVCAAVLVNHVDDLIREFLPAFSGMRTSLVRLDGQTRVEHEDTIFSPGG